MKKKLKYLFQMAKVYLHNNKLCNVVLLKQKNGSDNIITLGRAAGQYYTFDNN